MVIYVNSMRVLNCLVARLGNLVVESRLVENDLTQINALQQGKLGALNGLM